MGRVFARVTSPRPIVLKTGHIGGSLAAIRNGPPNPTEFFIEAAGGLDEAILDLDRASDRVHGAAKLDNASVAGSFHDTAVMSSNIAGLSAAMRGLIAARTAVMTAVAAIDADGGVRANSRAVRAVLASAHEQSVPIFQ